MTIASGFLQSPFHFNLPSGAEGFFNNDYHIFSLPKNYQGFLQNPPGLTLDSHTWASGVGIIGGYLLAKGIESGVGIIGGFAGGFQELMPSGNMIIGGHSYGIHGRNSGIIGGHSYGIHGRNSGIIGGYIDGIHGRNSGIIGGAISTETRGSGISVLGGEMYVLATPFGNKFIGGYMFGDAPFDFELVGGYLHAAQMIFQSGYFGGMAYGLRGVNVGELGGFTIGTWNRPGESILTNLSRVLIKGDDDVVIDQSFSTNAKYVLYKSVQDNFDAEVKVLKSDCPEFDAEIIVGKYHRNPNITIIDVQIIGEHPWTVTIEASGHSFDSNNEIIVSGINEMDFIWSDGEVDELRGSGMIYSCTHKFLNSGIYQPTVMGYDKNRRAGSDSTELNFASGLAVPAISLSGIPRSGINPLFVDFAVTTSGVIGTYDIFWDFGNGLYFYSNSPIQTTQYPMPGDYTPHVRMVDDRGIMVVDTLKIGYNR